MFACFSYFPMQIAPTYAIVGNTMLQRNYDLAGFLQLKGECNT